jgi:hypothetical protein
MMCARDSARREKGLARQKIDERADIADTGFQEVFGSDFPKNAFSKFFRAQAPGIARFAQIKIWKNLQASRN